jgi:glycosyltransferase involved in cell wall biosynthesis
MTAEDKRLKIVQMPSDYGTGGIARHVLDLSSWLEAQGHLIYPASTPGEWAGPETHERFLPLPTQYISAAGGSLPARLRAMARASLGLRRWLGRNPVDLIHAHESAPALAALIARAGRGVPVAVTYHGSDPDRVSGFGRIARHADLVITPSHRAAEDLAGPGGVPKDKIKVIGLGIKPAPQDTPKDVAALRRELLGDGTQLVVSMSRIAYQKGVDVLIDVVARMAEPHPGIRFAIVGDGPLEAEMKALAKTRGVADRLIFAGRTTTPYRYLRAADMMLLTSRWEALPISIVEAFRVGTPVVATDCSGVHELVDDTVGACVPIGDVPAISGAVAALLKDPTHLAAAGAAALDRSTEDRFDPDWINARFEATYRALANR